MVLGDALPDAAPAPIALLEFKAHYSYDVLLPGFWNGDGGLRARIAAEIARCRAAHAAWPTLQEAFVVLSLTHVMEPVPVRLRDVVGYASYIDELLERPRTSDVEHLAVMAFEQIVEAFADQVTVHPLGFHVGEALGLRVRRDWIALGLVAP